MPNELLSINRDILQQTINLSMENTEIELTILMPCLNESLTLEKCIASAKKYINRTKINAEILISDNGSTDDSREIARNCGAKVIKCSTKGYGAALINGINNAKGKYVIFADADCSYDFENLDLFVDRLRNGVELVVGNRFKGGIGKDAMPFLHKYLGNPLLSFIGKLFYTSKLSDFHCGLRGFNNEVIKTLGLRCTGMEFASEMIAKSGLANIYIEEVPTTLKKDERDRAPHLKTWRDGWRHLKFLFMFAPKPIFYWPGVIFLLLGVCINITLWPGEFKITPNISIHTTTLLMSCLSMVVGVQLLTFYSLLNNIRSKMFQGYWTDKNTIYTGNSFELALVISIISVMIGMILILISLNFWSSNNFAGLDFHIISRYAFNGLTFLTIGIQIFSTIFVNAAFEYAFIEDSK